MIKKSTLIVLVIMLAMLAGFILLQQKDQLDFLTKPGEPTQTPMPDFISLESTQLQTLRFSRQGEAEEVVISRQGEAEWQINVPGGAISAGEVEKIVSDFNAINTMVVLDVDLEGEASGLDNPQYVFKLELSGGESKTVKIGNTNPLGSGYYAQVDMDPLVIISTGSVNNIVKTIETAMTPPTPTPEPTEGEG